MAGGPTTVDNTEQELRLRSAVLARGNVTWTAAGNNFSVVYTAASQALTFTVGSQTQTVSSATLAGQTLITILARGNGASAPATLQNLTFNGTAIGNLSSVSTFEHLSIGNYDPNVDFTLSGVAVIPGGSRQAPRFEIALTNVPISVQLGAAAAPLFIYNNPLTTEASILKGEVVNLGGLVFSQNGVTGTFAGQISGTGSVTTASPGTVILTGANTFSGGVFLNGGILQVPNDSALGTTSGGLTFDGGTLQYGAAFALSPTRPLTLNAGGGSIDTNGNDATIQQGFTGPGSLTKLGAGSLLLTGVSTHIGGTNVSVGTLVVGSDTSPGAALTGGGPVSVAAGAVLGGYGSITGPLVNDGIVTSANATPGLGAGPTGNFTVTGDVLNRGLIDLAGSAVGNTFTVNGNYVGAGGTLGLNTVLGADGSPSDMLVINGGTASGNTSLRITNAGGPGARTTGNGILMVDAINGGTTAPGAFSLANVVAAGGFEYALFRGGVGGSDPDDWFLRSAGIRPDVPVHISVPPLATQFGFAMVGTFHERMGDPVTKHLVNKTPLSCDAPGTWARVLGETGKRDRDTFNGGRDYSWGFAGLQSGFDLWRGRSSDGACHRAGVYLGIGFLGADVEHLRALAPGDVDLKSYSLGGTWTRLSPNGWYVDAVLQGSLYDAKATTAAGRLSADGAGVVASIETGYPIRIGGRSLFEPQVQLLFQRTDFDRVSDGTALISLAPTEALMGRIGARLVQPWSTGSVWARVNLWHEFIGKTKVTLSGLDGGNPLSFETPFDGTWAEIGLGANGEVGNRLSVFATAAYQQSVDGQGRQAWNGRAGVTYRW